MWRIRHKLASSLPRGVHIVGCWTPAPSQRDSNHPPWSSPCPMFGVRGSTSPVNACGTWLGVHLLGDLCPDMLSIDGERNVFLTMRILCMLLLS
jgi:hypothetical protein